MTAATASYVDPFAEFISTSRMSAKAGASVLMVREEDDRDDPIPAICAFLGLTIEHVSPEDDLIPILTLNPPLVVIADLDSRHQDGCHVMKMVGATDPDLPVLLLTDADPVKLGAVDAVRGIWGLTRAAASVELGGIGGLVTFLCHAMHDRRSYELDTA